MERPVKPRKLRPGDRLAAVTLSWGGPGAFPERYAIGKAQLETALDVELIEMPHTLREPEFLDRHPEARAADLMQAFADPDIAGIVSTIGGDDSIRLLPHLDLERVRRHPKVLLGYSDTTISHLACWRAGLGSFFGPAVLAGFAEEGGPFPYMVESVKRTLFRAEPIGEIAPNREGWTAERVDWGGPRLTGRRKLQPAGEWRFDGSGRAEGHLLGGTLEVLEFLRGTEWWPSDSDWDGALLFLETSEEAPAPDLLARILRVYAHLGLLQRLAGILLGRPGGEVDPDDFARYDSAIDRVVRRETGLDYPIVTGMDFGHTDPMFVIPYGARARLDCDAATFAILDSAVVDGP